MMDDSEGITLRSLGGVFIATLIGLGLALLTLAVGVVLQKRKESTKVKEISKAERDGMRIGSSLADHLSMKKSTMPAIIGH